MTVPLTELVDPATVARLRELAGTTSEEPAVDPDVEIEEKADGAIEHKNDPGIGGAMVLDSDADTGVVTALVSVTGIEDRVKDIIEPGAYTKTMAEREPIGVWSHDDKTWVARTEDAAELMPGDPFLRDLKTMDGKPWPKEAGAVKVTARFNLDTPHGAAAFSDVDFFKGKTGWSIGYRATKSFRNPRTGVRRIKELEWYEYSPVMAGAATQPMTLSVKSMAQPVDAEDPTGWVGEDVLTELTPEELVRFGELKASLGLEVKDVYTGSVAGQTVGMGTAAKYLPCPKCGGSSVKMVDGVAECAKDGTKLTRKVQHKDDDAAGELEVKDRVRTAAGQERFKQPIGSVIIPDGLASGPISDTMLSSMMKSAVAKNDPVEQRMLKAASALPPEKRRALLTSGHSAINSPLTDRLAGAKPGGASLEAVGREGAHAGESLRAGQTPNVAERGSAIAPQKHGASPAQMVAEANAAVATAKAKQADAVGLPAGVRMKTGTGEVELAGGKYAIDEYSDGKYRFTQPGKFAPNTQGYDTRPEAIAAATAHADKTPLIDHGDSSTDAGTERRVHGMGAPALADAAKSDDTKLAAAAKAEQARRNAEDHPEEPVAPLGERTLAMARANSAEPAPSAALRAAQNEHSSAKAARDAAVEFNGRYSHAHKVAQARLDAAKVQLDAHTKAADPNASPADLEHAQHVQLVAARNDVSKAKADAAAAREFFGAHGSKHRAALARLKSAQAALDALQPATASKDDGDLGDLEVKGTPLHNTGPLSTSRTSNWVARSGGLPPYVREVVRGIMKSGKTEEEAIPIAIGRIKRWAAGGDGVDPDTVAKAVKALAQWEALKAKNGAKYDSDLLATLEFKATQVEEAWGVLLEAGELDELVAAFDDLDYDFDYDEEVKDAAELSDEDPFADPDDVVDLLAAGGELKSLAAAVDPVADLAALIEQGEQFAQEARPFC